MHNFQRGRPCLNFAYFSMQFYNPGYPKGGPWHNTLPLNTFLDLPTCTDSKMVLYADNAVLVCQKKSKSALVAKTEKELKNVKSWVACNQLSLNFDKTHCMLCSTKTKPQQHDFVLDIDGKKLLLETSVPST